MTSHRVVVDGSNIATEGRTTPSLAQLDEAVRAFREEHPEARITVVVDATFLHRIDESERGAFLDAQSHGEVVSPPAGAIGRGDAFLLRIAEKTGATVLSNDSFQEFHDEHGWLFDENRLTGGKPVPGVGWIFTPRTPVRSSRTSSSKPSATRAKKTAAEPKVRNASVVRAIESAEKEAQAEDGSRRRRRPRRGVPPSEAVNEPLVFIRFIADHRLGDEVEADVDGFTSHGAFAVADNARCYIPLSGLGDPPPRSARQVLKRGERVRFVLQALDPQRRGIELALSQFAHVAGQPTEETVQAEIVAAGQRAGGTAAQETTKTAKRAKKPATAKVGGQATKAKAAKGAEKPGTAKRTKRTEAVKKAEAAKGAEKPGTAKRTKRTEAVKKTEAAGKTKAGTAKRTKRTEAVKKTEAADKSKTRAATGPKATRRSQGAKAKAARPRGSG